MSELATCPNCGASQSTGQDGRAEGCLSCMMALALVTAPPWIAEEEEGGHGRFAHYHLREEIARGGMGVVYLAIDPQLDREVALKMILSGSIADEKIVARFQREARAGAMLDHPNIVPIYEIGAFEGQHYFAMRLIAAARPLTALNEHGPHDVPLAKRQRRMAQCLLKVVQAINYAHMRGVIHCDLKPSNILLDSSYEPHLTDFGLARILSHDSSANTHSKIIGGSPSYMSPEQAEGTGEITTATDIYGLGAVLYELLTGRPPHEGHSPYQVLQAITNDAIKPPRSIHPGIHPDLATIAMHCLHKAPGERYATADALIKDLTHYLQGEPITARPRSPLQRLVSLMRRRPAISILTALLLGAIVAGLTFFTIEAGKVSAANADLRANASQLEWQRIDSRAQSGETSMALASLAARLRENLHDWRAASYGLSLVENRDWFLPLTALSSPETTINAHSLHAEEARLLTVTEDGQAHLWDTQRGTLISTAEAGSPLLHGHYAPSPQRALTLSRSDELVLWDFSKKPVTALMRVTPQATQGTTGGTQDIQGTQAIALSPDGEQLFTLSQDGLRRFSLDEPEPAFLPIPGLQNIRKLILSEDGSRLAVVSDRALLMTSTQEFSSLTRIPFQASLHEAHFIDAAGEGIVTWDGQKRVRTWDSHRGEVRIEMDWSAIHPEGDNLVDMGGIRVMPDRRTLAVAFGVKAIIAFRDLESGQPSARSLSQTSDLVQVEGSPVQPWALTISRDFKAQVSDISNGELIASPLRLDSYHSSLTSASRASLLLTSDANQFTTSRLPKFGLWRYYQKRPPQRFDPNDVLDNSITISPQDNLIAIAVDPGGVQVIERKSGRILFKKPEITAWNVLFGPKQDWVIATTQPGHVHLFSLPEGRPLLGEPLKVGFRIRATSISPQGDHIAFGGNLGEVSVRTLPDLREVHRFSHQDFISGATFSRDGQRLLTASKDGTACLWDLKKGTLLTTLHNGGKVVYADFIPGKDRAVTADYAGQAKIWDLTTGSQRGAAMNHRSEVADAAISPNGKVLLTATRDAEARLWDLATGLPLTPPIVHRNSLVNVGFSPDGRHFFTVCLNDLRLFDAVSGQPITDVMSSGLVQSVAYICQGRKVITSDGAGILTGMNSERINYWDLPLPPIASPAPPWLPDFFEAVALLQSDRNSSFQRLSFQDSLQTLQKIQALTTSDWFTLRVQSHLTQGVDNREKQ